MNLPHLHLLLNHFPTVGMIAAIGLYGIALWRTSEELKQIGMLAFVLLALIAMPTYMTGNAAMDAISGREDYNQDLVEAHQSQALLGFIFMELTGLFAWLGLWNYRRTASHGNFVSIAIAGLAVITLLIMGNAASIGGGISHPEAVPDAGGSSIEMLRSSSLINVISLTIWLWPLLETLHFIGMAVLFGVVILIDLRLLGMMRNVSFAALHQLLPWAVIGFVVNTISGMAFFIGAYSQYIGNAVFYWKVALLLLAAVNALFLTTMDDTWKLEAGQEASGKAKLMAASALVMWVGVIYAGRMLPFIGNAF